MPVATIRSLKLALSPQGRLSRRSLLDKEGRWLLVASGDPQAAWGSVGQGGTQSQDPTSTLPRTLATQPAAVPHKQEDARGSSSTWKKCPQGSAVRSSPSCEFSANRASE